MLVYLSNILIGAIWKYSQIEETCKQEQSQNLDWEEKAHPRDYEDMCDAFTVEGLVSTDSNPQNEAP